ncbi:hypothetical protein EDB80DRAFT_682454 [Ilyonectria destructans]|nr:hypothetical protein EDB80DRAFT_682454 [Ilyonectria destructans]
MESLETRRVPIQLPMACREIPMVQAGVVSRPHPRPHTHTHSHSCLSPVGSVVVVFVANVPCHVHCHSSTTTGIGSRGDIERRERGVSSTLQGPTDRGSVAVVVSSRLVSSQYRPLLVPPRHHAKLGTPRPVDRPVIRRGPDSSGALARSLTFAPPTAAQPMESWTTPVPLLPLVALAALCSLARRPRWAKLYIARPVSPSKCLPIHPVGGYALIEYITRDSPHHCHLRTTDRLISLDCQRLLSPFRQATTTLNHLEPQ